MQVYELDLAEFPHYMLSKSDLEVEIVVIVVESTMQYNVD